MIARPCGAKPNVGFAAVVVLWSIVVVFSGKAAWADDRSAQADLVLRTAIDLYGEYAAALGVSEYCPGAFSKSEVTFIKSRLPQYVQAIQALSQKHGINAEETSFRLNALGQNNLKQVRQEVASGGCSSRKIVQTIDYVKKAKRRQN
ncbi:hypothetical protein [Kumtagia ephedrae]|jgi:hypothetical protein|uniref:hypothetical protein n=1 Tax=Kumtagia ephedrae TaxID=2116701 RepID=UPI001056F386|nr:hypothetical protein [Mesorhizobium ephedrae]